MSDADGDPAADVAAEDLDSVEETWLSRIGDDPTDIEYFVTVARRLAEGDDADDVGFLLELLDDELQHRRSWRPRLELLRRAGDLLFTDPVELHGAVIATIEHRHDDRPSVAGLIDKVGLHRAVDDIAKTWEKVDRLEPLLRRDEGTIVWMEGKGGGRVVETNLDLDRFKVDIANVGVVSVGFAAAPKLLEPLPEGHLARRAIEDPEELQRLQAEEPAELIRLTLASASEPLSASELRERLAIVVDDEDWSSLWSTVRQDSRLVALPGSTQRYTWADSADDAAAALAERFDDTDLAGRLELLRVHADRHEALREEMLDTLRESARRIASRDPTTAYTVAAALAEHGVELDDEPFAPARLLAADDDPGGLVADLERPLRSQAYALLADIDPEWPRRYRAALEREEDPEILDALAARLAAHDATAFERAVGDILTRPRRTPAAFTWLAERAAEDERLRDRSPLRLFEQILSALDDEPFRPYRQRLEALVESGSTLPRLLPHIDVDQAERARVAVERAPGLESYQRQRLANAIDLRFPALRRPAEDPLYAIPESIERKREELTTLLEEEIPSNRRAIEEARELGDLRENFEYKSARQRHEYLTSRAETLDRELGRARPIAVDEIDTSVVRIGTRAVLAGDGLERAFTILGPWESAPEDGVLSHESELAQRLLGLEAGEAIEIDDTTYTVERIERIG